MNKIYDMLIDIPKSKINYFKSINNRKTYGDRSSKLVIDVYTNNDVKIYTFELDYIKDDFYIYKRFLASETIDKRNENNFFDAQRIKNILNEKSQEKVIELIKNELKDEG